MRKTSKSKNVPSNNSQASSIPSIVKPSSSVHIQPSLMDSVKQGIGFGIGTEIARRGVDTVINTVSTPTPQTNMNSTEHHNISKTTDTEVQCSKQQEELKKCMKISNYDDDCQSEYLSLYGCVKLHHVGFEPTLTQ